MKKLLVFSLLLFLFLSPCINYASAKGYSLTVKTRQGDYVFESPEIYFYGGEYKLKDIDNKVAKIVADSCEYPQDASFSFTENFSSPLKVIKHKNGYRVNATELKKAMSYALKSGQTEITAVYEDLYPLISEQYLKNCACLLAEFSTPYASSSDARKHNIALAVSKLDKSVLWSGQTLSFNGVVGKRGKEEGFELAKVISGGKFTDGYGGGVCQVSTTLYNACLLAGLDIAEYHPHTLAVGYVEKSFDAMVSGYSDLKIVNDTFGVVTVFCRADGQNVTFKIYGFKGEFDYARESVITERIDYNTVGEKGVGELISVGKDGYKSKGYLCKYKDGVLAERKLIRQDYYKPVDEIWEIKG